MDWLLGGYLAHEIPIWLFDLLYLQVRFELGRYLDRAEISYHHAFWATLQEAPTMAPPHRRSGCFRQSTRFTRAAPLPPAKEKDLEQANAR